MSPIQRPRRTGNGEAPRQPHVDSEPIKHSPQEQQAKDTLSSMWEDGKQFGGNKEVLNKFEVLLSNLLSKEKELPAELKNIADAWEAEANANTLSKERKLELLEQLDDFLGQQPPEPITNEFGLLTVPKLLSGSDSAPAPDLNTLPHHSWETSTSQPEGPTHNDLDTMDGSPQPVVINTPPTQAPIQPSLGSVPIEIPNNPNQPTAPETSENEESAPSQEPEKSEGAMARLNEIHQNFRQRAPDFLKRFMGESLAEDEEDFQADLKSNAKKLGRTAAKVTGSIFGFKSFYDVPALITQEIATGLARREIKGALSETEQKLDKAEQLGGEIVLQQKVEAVTKAINESNYLTKTKKAELIKKIEAKIRGSEAHRKEIRKQRDTEIAALLNEAITTRVTRQEALKQTLNTAMKASGYGFARGAVYGAMSMYERHKKITEAGTEDGKEQASYFNRFVIDGVKDTFKKMSGGNADTWQGKAANVMSGSMDAARPFLIAAGLGNEMFDEASEAFDLLIEKYENGGSQEVGRTIMDTVFPGAEAAPLDQGQTVDTADTGSDTESTGDTNPDTNDTDVDTGSGAEADVEEVAAEAPPAELTPNTSPETPPPPAEALEQAPTLATVEEAFEGQRELALTKSEDGIIVMINRQLRANPEAFGFDGNTDNAAEVRAWAQKTSMEAARAQELIRTGGDTRLTEDAIGRLSVLAQAKEGGGIEISFFDGETKMTQDELETAKLTYEGGTRPGIVASEGEGSAQRLREVRGLAVESYENSDAPDEYLGGRVELDIQNEQIKGIRIGDITTKEREVVEAMVDMNAASERFGDTLENTTDQIHNTEELTKEIYATYQLIQVLEDKGFGLSPEAEWLRNRLNMQLLGLESIETQTGEALIVDTGTLTPIIEEGQSINRETLSGEIQPTEGIGKLKVRGIPGLKFTYTPDTGQPRMDITTAIESMSSTTIDKAEGLMVDGWRESIQDNATSPAYETGVDLAGRQAYLLTKALDELKDGGHQGSPEAAFLRNQLTTLLGEYGNVLDQDNDMVQQAFRHAQDAGFETGTIVPFSDEDLDSLPAVPRPVTDGGTDNLPPVARPAADAGIQPAVNPGAEQMQSSSGDRLIPRGEDTRFERSIYRSDDGVIKFSYDDKGRVDGTTLRSDFLGRDGSPLSAMPILKEEGVTHREVTNFFLNRRQTDMSTDVFERNIVRLERQEAILEDMQADGLEGTPEYEVLERMNQRGEAEKAKWLSAIKAAREPSEIEVQRAQAQAQLEVQAYEARRARIAAGEDS
ncbi:MAG: hypothetical protein P8J32_03190 [bacterium]|jgi:hypothetical protein|nr:hypothetical protein [bacterium]